MSRLLTVAVALAAAVQVSPARAAPTARAIYVAHEEETLWEPLDRKDVEALIERVTLDVLTRAGLLVLTKVEPKELAKTRGDYLLRISGRMVGESEHHTILLAFEARDQSEIGSFSAADTVLIGKLPREEMRRRIERSTREAAERLLAVLEPALARLALRQQPEAPAPTGGKPDEPPPVVTWDWAEVTVPKTPRGEWRALWEKSEQRREQTLRLLTAEALTEARPRNALETCVLEHPDEGVRLQCLVALRPLSRRVVPTQRVVIAAFRKDESSKVLEEATEQMLYFTGVSQAEAIQAWLERTANDGQVHGPIAQLGDLPNLDQVIARCLYNAAKKKREGGGCVDLVKPLPGARRRAVLERFLRETDKGSPYYLPGAGEGEGSRGTVWQWALDAVVESSCTMDDVVEDIAWQRYLRELSSSSLDALAESGTPSERLVERLVQALQTSGSNRAFFGLRRLYQAAPKLRGLIRGRLAELVATGNYNKKANLTDWEREFPREEGGR